MRYRNLGLARLLVRVRLNRVVVLGTQAVFRGVALTSLFFHVLIIVTFGSAFRFKLYEPIVWIMNLYFCRHPEIERTDSRFLHLPGFKTLRPQQKLIFSVVLVASR